MIDKLKKRQKIDLHTSLEDVIVIMSEGNPGAINVLTQIVNKNFMKGIMDILGLDDMNIRGAQIWIGYKDHCEQNIDRFIECIHSRDHTMVKTINNHYTEEQAVTSGASYTR